MYCFYQTPYITILNRFKKKHDTWASDSLIEGMLVGT